MAGYYNRLYLGSANKFTLFGTGGNSYVLNVQQRVYREAKRRIPEANNTNLVQVPIHLSVTRGIAKNRIMRARGFIFLLLGAACALTQGQNHLAVYENGVGAINLLFRLSEVGLDHTRAVHPLSLVKMSEFVSVYLANSFSFLNPFLFWTKAQMCRALANADCTELMFGTISCDRRLRSKPMQCGRCSSCLLRRQALAVQQVYDRTGYAIFNDAQHLSDRQLHLRAMLQQVAVLQTIFESEHPWSSLRRRYPILQNVVDELSTYLDISMEEVKLNLLNLYRTYSKEWDLASETVSEGILHWHKMPLADDQEYDICRGLQDGFQYT